MDSKLDLILSKLIGLEHEVGGLKQIAHDVSELKQDVGGLKQDVGGLKQDVGGLKQDVTSLTARMDRQEARIDELIAAFRGNWADMSNLYRRVREDVKLFEDRLEAKLGQVTQSIVALKESIDRQDFRSDSLGRRITALEERPSVVFDR